MSGAYQRQCAEIQEGVEVNPSRTLPELQLQLPQLHVHCSELKRRLR